MDECVQYVQYGWDGSVNDNIPECEMCNESSICSSRPIPDSSSELCKYPI